MPADERRFYMRRKIPALLAVLIAALLTVAPNALAVAPSVNGGKFEVTCKPRAIPDQSIDPIVSPGATSAHLHTFFGSKGLTSTSTPAQLQASTAGTTCVLAQDNAAYWVPVACNGPCNPVPGGDPERGPFTNVIPPVKTFAYYFGVPQSQAIEQQLSPNLQFIGGDSHATGPTGSKRIIAFSCGNGGSHSSPVRAAPYDCTAANGVHNTDGVVAIVTFPYCGPAGGTPTNYGDSTGTCVAPDVTYPQVQIHEHLGLDATGYQTGSTLNFSSGPYWTYHGDWMNGWNQAKLQALVSGCLDVDRDCGFLTATNPGPAATQMMPRAASCTATGKIPVISAQGFLSTHYSVNCTAGQSWTVDATVQAFINGSWQRALNTDVSTLSHSGDATVIAPVESGAWSCSPGRSYRSHAVLRGGNTDNSSATVLC